MWQEIKNIYHFFIAYLTNIYFGFLSKRFVVIGVTGTDGKTTTVSLIYHILKTAGYKVSMISSVGAIINDKHYDVGFHVTTPSAFEIQKFLKKTLEEDITPAEKRYLVLEVTSHALSQYRVFGIEFEIGVLTNVTHEHLDYHKTYENYVFTKAKLLQLAKKAVLNRDDESYDIIQSSKFKVQSSKLITYGIKRSADITIKNFPFQSKLIGEFNAYNALAAIAAAKEFDIPDFVIQQAITSFLPPKGRGEIVYDHAFRVMIDFAHTPNALEKLLSELRPKVGGRIIHVFGCAGRRDFAKRPLMGKISGAYADIIILTSEDPRSESVEDITLEIESGIKKSKKNIFIQQVYKITDRKEAIATAIRLAQKDDFVLLTGKGHETSMNFGKGEVAWSEHEAVKEALKIFKY